MAESAELQVTDRTREVMRLSAAFSEQCAHDDIQPQDLLSALAHKGGISDVVLFEVEYPRKKAPPAIPDADRMVGASAMLKAIVADAQEEARVLGHNYIGTEHLLLVLARTYPGLVPNPEKVRLLVLRILGHAK